MSDLLPNRMGGKDRRYEISMFLHLQGMVMVSPEMNPTICWMFEAEIVLLFHAKTFHKGFQVTVHIGNVRQTATVEAVYGKVSSSNELKLLLSCNTKIWVC